MVETSPAAELSNEQRAASAELLAAATTLSRTEPFTEDARQVLTILSSNPGGPQAAPSALKPCVASLIQHLQTTTGHANKAARFEIAWARYRRAFSGLGL